MNLADYDRLKQVTQSSISGAQLRNQTPRTLLYGYTLARQDWHVYLDTQGQIHQVCYHDAAQPKDRMLFQHRVEPFEDNSDLIPSKRLNPELCDYEFCSLLRAAGEMLPFTTYETHTKTLANPPYAGRTLEGLERSMAQPLDTAFLQNEFPRFATEQYKVVLDQAAIECQVPSESVGNLLWLRQVDTATVQQKALWLLSDLVLWSQSIVAGEENAQLSIEANLMHLGFNQRYAIEAVTAWGGCLTASIIGEAGAPSDFSPAPSWSAPVDIGTKGKLYVRGRQKIVLVPRASLEASFRYRVYLYLFGCNDLFLAQMKKSCA
ncbi:MAG: hypothetical protein Q7S87_01410 [Agitococcus sp.]|nr:hypothetical protein [Agitococcus sp.]MDO9177120.1 hypothetical protein [Agitococcus sp.]